MGRWGFLLLSLWFTEPVLSAPVKPGNTEAELVAAHQSIRPGKPLTVALRLRMDAHWHTYWKNPGDAGLPTTITWTLPKGYRVGAIQWPHPQRINVGRLTSYGYEGEVFLLMELLPPGNAAVGDKVSLSAQSNWLECRENCIPQQALLSLTLPVSNATKATPSLWSEKIEATRRAIPQAISGWKVDAHSNGESIALSLSPPPGMAKPFGSFHFFSENEGVVEPSGLQILKRAGANFVLTVPIAARPTGDFNTLSGVLVADHPWPGIEARAVSFSAPLRR